MNESCSESKSNFSPIYILLVMTQDSWIHVKIMLKGYFGVNLIHGLTHSGTE